MKPLIVKPLHILMQLKNKQGEFYDLWLETRKWSIELMKETYRWSDVEFDHWFLSQKSIRLRLPMFINYMNKVH